MNPTIYEMVAAWNAQFDWTGIREGGFQFGAKEVRASGWDGDSYRWYTASAETPAKAYAALRQEIPSGQQRVEKLRADAAKLLAEADAIATDSTIQFP